MKDNMVKLKIFVKYMVKHFNTDDNKSNNIIKPEG